MIIRITGSLSCRAIDKMVVPTDYFKTCSANLVFCYRGGDLVLLHLDFTRLPVERPRPAIEDNESPTRANRAKGMMQHG